MSFDDEVSRGERFRFGRNWNKFSEELNEERIRVAELSLLEKLGQLEGKTFLDVGSGSGLFSLAAYRLGAKVFSFDYDPESVQCTLRLKEAAGANDSAWSVFSGSILDKRFLEKLDAFDFVYSWGVLHHTGKMWEAIKNVCSLRNETGSVFIAIYNDQGLKSRLWTHVKKIYCSNAAGRLLVATIFVPSFFLKTVLASIVFRKNLFSHYHEGRGMSIVHDWTDWLGGYPFEVASPDEVVEHFLGEQMYLSSVKVNRGHGCSEFVFKPFPS